VVSRGRQVYPPEAGGPANTNVPVRPDAYTTFEARASLSSIQNPQSAIRIRFNAPAKAGG